MRNFAIKPLVVAMAFSAIPMMAQAQNTSDSSQIEEVLVTGSYRASLASGLDIKRNSANAVDTIKAEDVADFPDNNLAESLQRLPGVAISRSGGEGKGISVRGLGPEYTRVRINGVEAISTTGGTDAAGGTNRGRGFDFNTFSSDLFSSLTVNKTAMASIEEGSLGATVDLKSAQPFDFNELVITASAQGGYNELAENIDPNASFLVSNVFNDGMFGALLSMSYSERTLQEEGTSTVRWENTAGNRFGTLNGTAIGATHEANSAFRPRIPRYDSFNHDISRLGASLSLQARPTDATEISLDTLYAKHEANRQEVFWEASLNGSHNTATNLLDYAIDGNTLSYANMNNVRLLAENRYDEMETEFTQVTLTVKHDFSDDFKGSFIVGNVKSEYVNPLQNTAIMRADGQEFSYDFRGGEEGVMTFGSAAYLPSSWTLTEIRQRPQGSTNEFNNIVTDFEYTLNDALSLQFGLNYKKFEFSTYENRLANETAPAGVNAADYIINYNSGQGTGGPWLIADRAKLVADFDIFGRGYNPQTPNTYGAEEETTGGFVQLNFDTEMGSTPVRGNIGLRHFSTDQSTYSLMAGGATSVDHSYDEILPSANIAIEPIENVIIRAAYSEGIARAGLGSIKPETGASVAGSNFTISGSNPFLEPTKAKSYDLGIEMYFDNESALGLTVFRKDLESQVQTLRTTQPLGDILDQTGLNQAGRDALVASAQAQCDRAIAAGGTVTAADCNTNPGTTWAYSIPLNAPGGDLYGFEVSYQTPFSFLPGFWSNFGFIGNFTYVKGQIEYLDSNGNVELVSDLENMSVTTSSATLYYENNGFQTRISLADRGEYLTNARGRNGNSAEGTFGTTNIDMSASYQINDNWKVSFEALNLTDEADHQWVDSADLRNSYYHTNGRQYYLGVQYKY
jgi:iron complex outermembrane receptor protein